MSLVPVFVMADDGKMYKDPILGEEDWFLCFDDDDDPEIVVKEGKITIFDVAAKIPGCVAEGRPAKAMRCFDKDGLKFHDAEYLFVALTRPIPTSLLLRHGKTYESVEAFLDDDRECVFYTFGLSS